MPWKDPETRRAYDRSRTKEKMRRYRATDRGRERNNFHANASQRLKKYGVSPEQYDEMLLRQDGGCAVCGEETSTDGRALAVDHDHATGRVRGLLCSACNLSIGHFKDSPALLRAAAEYLEATS